MGEHTPEGLGLPPERQSAHLPEEVILGALGEVVVAGAEQLTRSTANGKPGDRPSALQGMDGYVTMLQIRAVAAEIQKNGPQADGRI